MADEPATQQKLLHLMISGRVQGVSYRAWMQGEALARGLSGWVRNRANGDVEAVLAGALDLVETLYELCRSGPPMARVDHILTSEVSPSDKDMLGPQGSFLVLPTL